MTALFFVLAAVQSLALAATSFVNPPPWDGSTNTVGGYQTGDTIVIQWNSSEDVVNLVMFDDGEDLQDLPQSNSLVNVSSYNWAIDVSGDHDNPTWNLSLLHIFQFALYIPGHTEPLDLSQYIGISNSSSPSSTVTSTSSQTSSLSSSTSSASSRTSSSPATTSPSQELPQETPKSSSSGLTSGAKAGIAIGAVLGVIAVAAVSWLAHGYWAKRRRTTSPVMAPTPYAEMSSKQLDPNALNYYGNQSRLSELDNTQTVPHPAKLPPS